MALRVLVVDDSPAVRLVLRRALLRVGVPEDHIFDTDDGGKAMRLFQRYHPEVVFMDLTLRPRVGHIPLEAVDDPTPPLVPDTSEAGEVLAKLMLYRDPTLKLVVCTGADREGPSVREVVKYGAFQVLEKPVTLDKVLLVFQLLAAEGLTPSSSGPFREGAEADGASSAAHEP